MIFPNNCLSVSSLLNLLVFVLLLLFFIIPAGVEHSTPESHFMSCHESAVICFEYCLAFSSMKENTPSKCFHMLIFRGLERFMSFQSNCTSFILVLTIALLYFISLEQLMLLVLFCFVDPIYLKLSSCSTFSPSILMLHS